MRLPVSLSRRQEALGHREHQLAPGLVLNHDVMQHLPGDGFAGGVGQLQPEPAAKPVYRPVELLAIAGHRVFVVHARHVHHGRDRERSDDQGDFVAALIERDAQGRNRCGIASCLW